MVVTNKLSVKHLYLGPADSGGRYTEITATAAEINTAFDGTTTATAAELQELDCSVNAAQITFGKGFDQAALKAMGTNRTGNIIVTYILIDLAGLADGDANGDIIGNPAGGEKCYFFLYDADIMGTNYGGDITCMETPAGGDPDIDLYYATEATGKQDGAIGSLTETQVIDHGDWTAGDVDALSAPIVDGKYVYLVCGTKTDATYTAGQLMIKLYGYAS